MIGRPIANFERWILTPLSFLLPIAALVFFVKSAWLLGVYFLFTWFCVALIGQGIHKEKSFDEMMSQGDLTAENNIRPIEDSERDGRELLQPLMFTAMLCGLTVTVLLFHYGFRWFISIPIGVFVAIVMPTIWAIVFTLIKK
jgi:hypothetical protein